MEELGLAKLIALMSRWVDAEEFCMPTEDQGTEQRAELFRRRSLPHCAKVVVAIGRMDSQKNPELLLNAFCELLKHGVNPCLLFVGDGLLRKDLERHRAASGGKGRIRFLGLQMPQMIAKLLHPADVLALASAYECMPMALREALASSVPKPSADLGEVERVIAQGQNGTVSGGDSALASASAFQAGLNAAWSMRDDDCAAPVESFRPMIVLDPAFENYRRPHTRHRIDERERANSR